MAPHLPHWQVPRLAPGIEIPGWAGVLPLPPFLLADGSGPAVQQTAVRLAWNERALHVRFDCEDRDAWGTFTRRDDPLYQEEVVEVFLSPGAADPARYFEFEVSPLGTLFDATVWNPDSKRATMEVDPGWDCPDIGWKAGAGSSSENWWATLEIPWAALLPDFPGRPLPETWRANFYRIERPRHPAGSLPEFSAWSPTLTSPAEFHQPARFGRLSLE
jgi:hypothetical protein